MKRKSEEKPKRWKNDIKNNKKTKILSQMQTKYYYK